MSNHNLYRSNKINVATEYLLNDYSFFSTPDQYQHKDNFYVYDWTNGYYILDAEMVIVNTIKQIFGNSIKYYSHIRDIINQVQRLSPIIPNDQINPSHLINYRNGILDKTTNKLYQHSPRFYTTKKIPQNYVKESNTLNQYSKRLQLLNFID
jgi:phage/plasmid-associated DNA primase